MITKLKKTLIFSALLCLIFTGCTSTSQDKSQAGTRINLYSYSSIDEEPFYVQNRDTFVEKKLSNGIPFIIKKSKNQKNSGVRLVIDAVPLSNPLKKAGLENLTLSLMKEGSEKYSSLYISSLQYTDSAFFISKVHTDYLEYGFTSQKENIAEITQAFADTFKNPVLPYDVFNEINVVNPESSNYILDELYKLLNERDSYFSPLTITKDSSISYKDVTDYHRELLNAARIKIIASGNFTDEDIESLYSAVNKSFGSLKSYQFKKKVTGAQNLFSEKKLEVIDKGKSKDISVIGFYKIPAPLSDEYLNYGLMSLFLDDILYNQIKEKYSYASDAGTGVLMSKSNLGIISIYDVLLLKNISEQVYSAVEANFNVENLQKKIEAYKRVYISFVMSAELSDQKTLDQMASSFVYLGDPREYIKRPYKISKITAEDVSGAYNSTVKENINWITNGSMTK